MLTPEQIQAARQKYGIQPQNQAVQNRMAAFEAAWNPPEPSFSEKHPFISGLYEAEKGLATGVAKGGTSTFLGLGRLGQNIQRGVGSAIDTLSGGRTNLADTAKGGIFDPESQMGQTARDTVIPEGTAEKIGFSAEQIGEYFIPAGAATKTEKLVTEASTALPGIWGATARILGKGVAQGVPAAGVNAVQTGGDDLEGSLEAGLFASATRAAMATIGEGARALKVPERLYQTIFKNTKQDMLHELKSEALINWERSNPEEFKAMVEAGIVKVGKDGTPIVNKTLAEQALDHGLRGNVQTMANTVVKGAHRSEASAQALAAAHKTPIDLSHGNYIKVLDDVAKEYDGVGFNEVVDEANTLASKLELAEGKVDATTALQLRRFFDRLRVASSFDKPASKLSLTQQNFKTLADTVRGEVNSIPGMEAVMKNYGYYIDALDSLAQYAKRTGNNQILSMIDSIFLGAGLGTGSAAPVFLGAARRAINTPGIATGIGQKLKEGVMGAFGSGALGAGASGVEATSDQ